MIFVSVDKFVVTFSSLSEVACLHSVVHTVTVGGSYTDRHLEGFMLVAVPLNAQDETTAMGTFQVNILFPSAFTANLSLIRSFYISCFYFIIYFSTN